MRRSFIILGIMLLVQSLAGTVWAQQDKLAGKWEGTIKTPQGERPATVTFKKEKDGYVGKMPGMSPDTQTPLKDIKIDGNKVTAKSEIEGPRGTLTFNYKFTLENETLNGEGTAEIGGQSFTFDIILKRVSNETSDTPPAKETQPGEKPPARQQPQRSSSAQPQQKQSIDYFVGQWSYKYIGRESALGPAPRDCTVTFTKRPDGISVEGVTECKHEGGVYHDTSVIVFDESTKMLTVTEHLNGGATLTSRGDWTSPISIRFTIEPVTIKGQPFRLNRTISVVSAHSFTVAEELSENSGPFARLGNTVVTRVYAK